MSKGSKRRPGNQDKYREAWAKVWGKPRTPLDKWAVSDVGNEKAGSIPNKISDNLDRIPPKIEQE